MLTLLDGGLGRELKRLGAPFRQPEWSALALMEAPECVTQAHRAFIQAGAEVITTNAYAVVPFHIGEACFAERGLALATLAGKLARDSVAGDAVTVAGSLPPLFGSYQPALFDAQRAPELLATLIEGQAPYVDVWLAETLSATEEARAVAVALGDDTRPRWFSFTLQDADENGELPCVLRSGEGVDAAVNAVLEAGGEALLFNCSQAEVMEEALRQAHTVVLEKGATLRLGVYANSFVPQSNRIAANAGVSDMRDDLGPDAYADFAQRWQAAGATMIGGCCGIGPEHIAKLADAVRS
ncbi:homocysteine S-methyltransferase family protein [Halomonas sp. CnH100-B]|uniref:homocysteine S-methyltransferase family protein n=1 Tax=Halomonadaceae TaxID=28256 RepID=UPI00209782A2|nr:MULTISPECIES: homocysteine S-methyltransferase family protein [Halomonas]MCO7227761.1 homocysteine S-methyltransferase family protein [Halomonas sp. CnH100-B]MDP4556281.1 homocysteine S-methyltransferase family protein [Halomonas meridiana]